MHGVKRIKTTEEKERERKAENVAKIKDYTTMCSEMLIQKKTQKHDADSLKLSEKILMTNPDFYVAWNFRREIFLTLQKTDIPLFEEQIKRELVVTEKCIAAHSKSYWVWLHRKWLSTVLPDMDWARELALCEKLLSRDARNFHCWNYRRYVSKCAGKVFADDLAFTLTKINDNFSNYSAWHQRSFLLPLVYTDPATLILAMLKELDLVRSALYTEPSDQSGWIYLRWLVGTSLQHIEKFESTTSGSERGAIPRSIDLITSEIGQCMQLREIELGSKWVILTCVYLNTLLVQCMTPPKPASPSSADAAPQPTTTDPRKAETLQSITSDLKELVTIDPCHSHYYTYLLHHSDLNP
ncbi:protein geranylgeranyltransferase type II [Pelomyxa schiedti]|nr:protein geranylgeranyltransferase type II [Pelomyxa schiedti]